MARYVLISCLTTALAVSPCGAQAPAAAEASAHVDVFRTTLAALGAEGATIDGVTVPADWGDGRVTDRDLRALARYSVWGFNTILSLNEQAARLDAGAEQRMVDFWLFAWGALDDRAKQVISVADVLWPTIARAWQAGTQEQREAMVYQFAELMQRVWQGTEQATVEYLAGRMGPAEYVAISNRWIAELPTRGSGDTVGDALMALVAYARAADRTLVQDGTGPIVYPEGCCG